MSTTAQVIQLSDRRVIRLKRGETLLGYFSTIDQVTRALEGSGLSLADLEITD